MFRAVWIRGLFAALVGALVALLLGGSPAAAAGENLLLGRSPEQSPGVRGTGRLTDGVAALPGEDWETDLSGTFVDGDAYVIYDLGSVVTLTAFWLQADANDDYRIMLSEDGEVFEQVWDAPRVGGGGMQDRSTKGLSASGRYLRVEPLRGDNRYAVSELAAFAETPAVFPPGVPRERGTPLEVAVRTKVLIFAAFAVAFLFLTRRGAPLWWLALCALPALATLADALLAISRAWPVEQRQVSLVRAAVAAIAAAAIAREVFAPARLRAHRAAVVSCLAVSGVVAVLAFYNLGRPQFWDSQQQEPTPIHLLDLRQYYGTVKYFDELGYRGMYLADVAAYIEDIPGASLQSLRDTPMRDLSTHRMTTIGEQREKIEAIKSQFSPERWDEYKRDARYFREVMGQRDYLRYMFDYGGNATPVWISIAHYLFSGYGANTTAFLLTGLLDPLLFLIAFVSIGLCFGYRSMFVVMVVFGANDFIMYGSNWGGATLRHDWLMYIALGACALKRKRWALGGFFLALSTTIRAFPVITLATGCFPALWWAIDEWPSRRKLPPWSAVIADQRPLLRTLAAAAITAVALVTVTSLRWSLPTWGDWLSKVARLSADPHGNSIALRGLIAGWQTGHHQLLQARWPLYAAAIGFYVIGVFLTCRHKSLERAAILGLLLVPVVFYPANYYIHIVCLLPLIAVEHKERSGQAPLSSSDAWVWLILLGLCAAQYWTVLVTDLPLHFHLSTVLLFGALTAIVIVLLRADLREGRLDFVARWLEATPDSPRAPAAKAAASEERVTAE
jgi:hypothetical protein